MNKDWIINFNDGSSSQYHNSNLLDAVNQAVNDWYPAKRVIGWQERQLEDLLDNLKRHQK